MTTKKDAKRKPRKSRQIGVRLSPRQEQGLAMLADEEQRSCSEIVRGLIDAAIARRFSVSATTLNG